MMAADALGYYRLALLAIFNHTTSSSCSDSLLTKQYSGFNLVSRVAFLWQH